MADSKADREQMLTDIRHKTAKRQDDSQTLAVKHVELAGTRHELKAALACFDKLKPTCANTGISYEDHVARRKQEVESLQQGLTILNGESV